MQKYIILTQHKLLNDGRIVRRIQAVRDFGHVKKGDVGGFIESVDNLSHKGNCWIERDAVAAGWSRVSGDALLTDRARMDRYSIATDRVIIGDNAFLDGYVSAYDDCMIGLFSYLTDGVIVRDHVSVMCQSRRTCSGKNRIPNLRDNAIVEDFASLEGRVFMADRSRASGHTTLKDSASLADDARAGSHSTVQGKTKMIGNSYAGGHTVIGGRSKLMCRASACGRSQLFNVVLSGDECRV